METKGKNEKCTYVKKASIRQKPPVIKQTKTSMYRMVKANPLLLLDEGIKDDIRIKGLTLPPSVDTLDWANKDTRSINIHLEASIANESSKITSKQLDSYSHKTKKPAGNVLCSTLTNNNLQCKNLKSMPLRNIKKPDESLKLETKGKLKKYSSLKGNNVRCSLSKIFKENISKNTDVLVKGSQKLQNPWVGKSTNLRRRSKSAERYQIDNCFKLPVLEKSISKTKSMENISKDLIIVLDKDTPKNNKKCTVTFKTPTAYDRRSVAFFTPTYRNSRKYTPYASTPGPSATDLLKQLNEWLKKSNKPYDSYHHLKYFCFKDQEDVENKENIEGEVDLSKNGSYEYLGIINEKSISKTENFSYVRDAMSDLHKLIQDEYSGELCEAWLGKIRQKCIHLEEEPEYWECRAALEQSKGNITVAVECYRTAIIKGAEINVIDESLDQLLQKFSLLNISDDSSSEESRKKARIISDARHAFKSVIIKYAIQEMSIRQ